MGCGHRSVSNLALHTRVKYDKVVKKNIINIWQSQEFYYFHIFLELHRRTTDEKQVLGLCCHLIFKSELILYFGVPMEKCIHGLHSSEF